MQRILWTGNPFFVRSLAACGWTHVYYHSFQAFEVFTFDDLVRAAGFVPDVLVVADKSLPPFILGVEEFPCLTVFYAVDSHLQSWYPNYAQAFDLCLLSLKDHFPFFVSEYLTSERILWSPPFALDSARPPEIAPPKRWDCLFVGNVNSNTPRRKEFLARLQEREQGLFVTRGSFVELFPQARVLFNYCEHGDLNFRVFEALGMGGALVSPRIANGQDELFRDGTHCLLYTPDDVDAASACIRRLLADDTLRSSLARNGLAAVDSAHRATHRAKAFTEHVSRFWPEHEEIIAERRSRARMIRRDYLKLIYLLWAREFEDEAVRFAYLSHATGNFSLAHHK